MKRRRIKKKEQKNKEMKKEKNNRGGRVIKIIKKKKRKSRTQYHCQLIQITHLRNLTRAMNYSVVNFGLDFLSFKMGSDRTPVANLIGEQMNTCTHVTHISIYICSGVHYIYIACIERAKTSAHTCNCLASYRVDFVQWASRTSTSPKALAPPETKAATSDRMQLL